MERIEVQHRLDQHEGRISGLEIGHAKIETQIPSLAESIDKLDKTLNNFMYSLMIGGGGFIIWYIQNK